MVVTTTTTIIAIAHPPAGTITAILHDLATTKALCPTMTTLPMTTTQTGEPVRDQGPRADNITIAREEDHPVDLRLPS